MSDKKMSKSLLCGRTKIARTTLDAILNGSDAKISTIESLANALGVPVTYFFDEENDTSPKEVRQSIHGDNSPSGNSITQGDKSVAGINSEISISADNGVNKDLMKLQEETARQKEKIKHLESMIAEKEKRIAEKEKIISLYETMMQRR